VGKSLTWSKLSKVLKNSYVELAILSIIFVGSGFAFWFGVKTALRTEYPLLVVASQSMLPTLDVSDIIIVQGTNPSEIKAAPELQGDIIVFYQPYNWDVRIVHRAINMTLHDGFWYFQTQGDNRLTNPGPDTWTGPEGTAWNGMISEKLLVGKVVGVIPLIGNVPLFIRTPQGPILIILLFILMLFLEFVPELWGKHEQNRKSSTSQNLSVWRNH
jgi:signal peptidase I